MPTMAALLRILILDYADHKTERKIFQGGTAQQARLTQTAATYRAIAIILRNCVIPTKKAV